MHHLFMLLHRLFIGNFQVPMLKKWIDNDQDNQLDDTTETLPRDSVESASLSTMRRRVQ
jgi:hypothetical protein